VNCVPFIRTACASNEGHYRDPASPGIYDICSARLPRIGERCKLQSSFQSRLAPMRTRVSGCRDDVHTIYRILLEVVANARLYERIANHMEFGNKLFGFDDAEELKLSQIYEAGNDGVIIASSAEGFGRACSRHSAMPNLYWHAIFRSLTPLRKWRPSLSGLCGSLNACTIHPGLGPRNSCWQDRNRTSVKLARIS
jgi:hypothetical protein